MSNLSKFFKRITILLMPQRCPFCRKVIKEDEMCCKNCLKTVPVYGITRGVAGGYRCSSAFLHKGKFRRAIINFKFRQKTQYSKQLAYFLFKSIQRNFPDMVFDYITYVPMHEKSERKRGYNQSELIAKDLSELLHIPCRETLIKTKITKPQHEVSGKKRRTNLKGAFKTIDKKAVQNKSVLLIDDIVTTGSTLGECAKTLQKCNPAHICCAAVLTSGNLY